MTRPKVPLRTSFATLAAALVCLPPTSAGAQASGATSCRPVDSQAATADSLVVPMEFENNRVYVPMCVGNRELLFILDTGAGQSFLDLGIAKELGISIGSPFAARGAGPGTMPGAQLVGASGTLAGTSIVQRFGSGLDISRLSAREGRRLDGILGYDFISTRVLAIDYAASRLRLYDRRTFRYAGGGSVLSLTFANNHPHVEAEVQLADGESIRGTFVVDVGSGGGLALTKPFVDDHNLRQRVGPTLSRPGGVGAGGQTSAVFGRVATLQLGSLALSNVVTGLYGDSSGVFSERGPWVGNIGGDLLRRFTVYFDYAARKMMLEPNAAFRDTIETDMSGIGVVANEDAWVVEFVLANTPAADAGFESGDVIVQIDGRPVDRRAIVELRKRFRRAGERPVLTIRRGGETKTLTLVTRRLV